MSTYLPSNFGPDSAKFWETPTEVSSMLAWLGSHCPNPIPI